MDMSGGNKGLPEAAYRPLKDGETYTPYVTADKVIPEITVRSIVMGIVLGAIFTLATAVSGLRAGTVFEAAIPVAILAIGIGKMFARQNTILENVIIQSIGGASGAVVAGAVFTLPTLFMLGLEPNLVQVFFVSLLGGMLGILFLIPLRRYFVADQHGHLPFPEATAVNEILIAGESAGKQAGILAVSMLVGGLYDFFADGLRLWGSHFNWRVFGEGFSAFTTKTKYLLQIENLSFFVGLGYIVGLKYSAIIVMGSFMSWFVLVPLFGWVAMQFPDSTIMVGNVAMAAATLEPETIFRNFVQRIGIGAIAVAGMIGIVKSLPVIIDSLKLGFKGLQAQGTEAKMPRTDRDMNFKVIGILLGITMIALAIFLYITTGTIKFTVAGVLIIFIISFLFTTVAANAIAIVGTNPVSGMTMMTIILSSAVLVGMGLTGDDGMFIALVIGGVVCTSLSVAGAFVSDLKVGYWLGSTPQMQQRFKFAGVLIAAVVVGLAIILINSAFGFMIEDPQTHQMVPNPAMPAPQANLMREIITTFMNPDAVIPWVLLGIGGIIALVMNWVGVPALAFGLGMYLPMEINTPLLFGAFVAYLIKKSSGDDELANARHQKGTLVASGFIAGAALFKILEAILRVVPGSGSTVTGDPASMLDTIHVWLGTNTVLAEGGGFTNNFAFGMSHDVGILVGLVFILALSAWMFYYSWKAKPE
jgi:putative OPT family oligopeptide transporter